MLAPVNSTHFSWSFKLGRFIMLNVLEALDKILRGDYCLNSCYSLIIWKNRYTRSGSLDACFLTVETV